MTNEERVLRAAKAWWKTRRPSAWTRTEHLETPTINCISDAEKKLARVEAKLIKEAR
jgi:hypothetical protein